MMFPTATTQMWVVLKFHKTKIFNLMPLDTKRNIFKMVFIVVI